MPVLREPKAEPIPGYKLLEPLGSGGFGEVWKCLAPGGIFKAIKFVYGNLNSLEANSARAEEELRAIQHIKTIRHPFLLSIDRVEIVKGELVIVTELADRNLEELLHAWRAKNWPGIPRGELLSYLREAAEVLDLMNIQHHLQHLDVKPRNLFVVSGHVKVADFGLVNSLRNAGRIQLGAISPLSAAPELFLGKLSRHSDQYSLAIVYQELLTGTLPFTGKNVRQLLLQHTQQQPKLDALPERDRIIVGRALSKDPEKRFGSCMEFILALLNEQPPVVAAAPTPVPGVRRPAADTISNSSFNGDTWSGGKRPPVPVETLPGYRFLDCVSNSPLMDQWSVQAPDGARRLLKLVYGYGLRDKRLDDAIVRLRSLQHPALAPIDVVHV